MLSLSWGLMLLQQQNGSTCEATLFLFCCKRKRNTPSCGERADSQISLVDSIRITIQPDPGPWVCVTLK